MKDENGDVTKNKNTFVINYKSGNKTKFNTDSKNLAQLEYGRVSGNYSE